MSDFNSMPQNFSLLEWICDSTDCLPVTVVESISTFISHCNNNHTIRLLLRGIHLLECGSRKIYRLICYFPLKKLVLSCLVTLGLYILLKRVRKNRKLAFILSKGSDQSRVNRNLKDIEKKILSKLQQDLWNENIHLEENSWEQALDNGQRPVIVFCVISSRIGTDIENAMRGVHGNSPVVLVLLHCVLSSLLRGDLSDDVELLDPTMKNRMAGIAHFAFSDREGLYDCQQNSVGFRRLRYTISFLPP